MTKPSKPPVLLLHGICSTGATLGPLALAIKHQGYCVHTPTLAETARVQPGAIEIIDSNLTLFDLLEEAREHASQLQRETGQKPIVVGHSNGALLALALASEGRSAAVALVAPAPPASVALVPLWIRRGIFSRIFGRGWQNRVIAYRPTWPFAAETVPAELADTLCQDSGPVMDEAISLSRYGPMDPPPPLPCPGVIFVGAEDRLTPPRLTNLIGKRFGCPVLVLNGASHWSILSEPYCDSIALHLAPEVSET